MASRAAAKSDPGPDDDDARRGQPGERTNRPSQRGPTMSATILPSPPAAHRRRLRLTLAALLAVVGVTAAALWGVTALLDQVQRPEEFVRVEIPGEVSVSITSTGPHVVYYEGDEPRPRPEDIDVTGPDGAGLPVRGYGADLEYDVPGTFNPRGEGGRVGSAVGVFTTERAGYFTVGTEASAPCVLAIGDDLAPGTARAIVLPALLGVLALVGALVLAVNAATGRPAGRS